jgi:hypothetical protein
LSFAFILRAEDVSSPAIIAVYRHRNITDKELDSVKISESDIQDKKSAREYRFWVTMLDLIKTRYLDYSGVTITDEMIAIEQQRLLEKDYGGKFLKMENFQKEVDKDTLVRKALIAYRENPEDGEKYYQTHLLGSVSGSEWNTYKKYYNSNGALDSFKKSIDARMQNIVNFDSLNKSIMDFYWNSAKESITEMMLVSTLKSNNESYSELIKTEMQKVSFLKDDYLDINKINKWISEIVKEDDAYITTAIVDSIFSKIEEIENPEILYKQESSAKTPDNSKTRDRAEVSDSYALTSQSSSISREIESNKNNAGRINQRNRADGAGSNAEEINVSDVPMPAEVTKAAPLKESDYYFYGIVLIMITFIAIFLKGRKRK